MQCQSEEQQIDEYEERISLSDELCPLGQSDDTKIETARLILRKPCWDDVDAISKLANNIAVANMLSRMPHPYSKADAEEFVNKISENKFGNYVYAITDKLTGEFMGCCGIEHKQRHGEMEIGYWLGNPYWGRGYGTETAHALVDIAFENIGVEVVLGCCRIGNAGSRRILQKSGFQFVGTGTNFCLAENAQMPVEQYRLEKSIWASLKNWPTTDQRTG